MSSPSADRPGEVRSGSLKAIIALVSLALLVCIALLTGALKVGSQEPDISDLTHALWCDSHNLTVYQCKMTEE